MKEEITHLVVNWIDIDHQKILVGATDNQRWKWDTDAGMSGADAKSIVWVTLTVSGKGHVVSEQAHFFCHPEDPTRSVAMSNIAGLFEIAWTIKNENMENINAREKFFGKMINSAL
ncbi:hypothetical protein [Chryseobacterium sp. SIMBA_028]|uniref:hypothetical protein n=1 Tax=Chryseobacterium sp. SIMBA_028 TaxID=3085771 RepID=UPI00397BDEA5